LSQLYCAATEERTIAQLLDPALDVNRGDGKGGLPPFSRTCCRKDSCANI